MCVSLSENCHAQAIRASCQVCNKIIRTILFRNNCSLLWMCDNNRFKVDTTLLDDDESRDNLEWFKLIFHRFDFGTILQLIRLVFYTFCNRSEWKWVKEINDRSKFFFDVVKWNGSVMHLMTALSNGSNEILQWIKTEHRNFIWTENLCVSWLCKWVVVWSKRPKIFPHIGWVPWILLQLRLASGPKKSIKCFSPCGFMA